MPLITISHYPQDSLPKVVAHKLLELTRIQANVMTAPQPDSLMASGSQGTTDYYMTVTDQTELLGFVNFGTEISTKNQVMIIYHLAIEAAHQNKKIAQKLTMHLLSVAERLGCQVVSVATTKPFLEFFARSGFIQTNDPKQPDAKAVFILENPCPGFYLEMFKTAFSDSKRRATQFVPPLRRAQDLVTHRYHNEGQYLALHRSMLGQARKRIWLLSDAINSSLLDNEAICQALFRLVRRAQQAEIRILIGDDKTGAGCYNRTVELAQRLSSFIEIRTLKNSGMNSNEGLTVVDFGSCIYRKNFEDYSGFANYSSRLLAQRLEQKFEYYWQGAKPSLELRRLSI